ncbi:MAG: Sua5/YciO/YrdC/YwlC family protein [Bacillales bacterium]|jgi:L-threonylcarbamoyladenylate synthase|nr:Sua5/YciO/YrdC/YwlC family protein [Bacillales bacterium]
MNTKVWVVDNLSTESNTYPQLDEPARLLREGEVVAFPTETVYGLGANALDKNAIKKIFEAKGRPSDNPLIIHISNKDDVNSLASNISDDAQKIMNAFWPGPITLVLKKKNEVPLEVTAGLDTVAIRIPNHKIALELIVRAGVPIAAPSANLSGKPSPTNAEHVLTDLSGKISGVLDGGETGVGLESTVIDCTCSIPIILRPGGITKEQLEEVIGNVEYDSHLSNEDYIPRSPGMKYRHYAPDAQFILVNADYNRFQTIITEAKSAGNRVGILVSDEGSKILSADVVVNLGSKRNLLDISSNLYKGLRNFNTEKVDVIYGETFEEVGIGVAIMNRLKKSSGDLVVY